MNISDPRPRQLARTAARAGTILSAVAIGITAWGISVSGVPQASAATNAGPAVVITPLDGSPSAGQPLTEGGSATAFSLALPQDAACTGDSANAGYRVQSYMVPSSADPATLTYNAAGPVPAGLGASFRQPLFDATASTGYVDAQTANAATTGGPGPVVAIPALSLAVFEPGNIPAGTYNIGIACTLGVPGPAQLDKYWNTVLTVVTAAGDTPAGVTWTAVAPPPTTTTSTAPGSSTTSTTPASSTTSSTSTSSTSTSTSTTTSTTSTTRPTTTTTTTTTVPVCPATSPTTTTTAPAASTTTSTTPSTSTSSTSTSTSSTTSSTTSTTAPTTTSTSTTSTTAPTTTSTSTTSTTVAAAAAARVASAPLVAAAAETCLPAGTTVSSSLAAGGQITISSTGWKAGSDVTGVLHSDPVTLGTLTADSTGRIAGSLTVPSTVPPGDHELVLTGTDPGGLVRTVTAPVTVTAAASIAGSGPGGGSGTGSGSGGLPVTGSSTVALIVWSVLLLVFGRMAVLLGRPPRVLPPLR